MMYEMYVKYLQHLKFDGGNIEGREIRWENAKEIPP